MILCNPQTSHCMSNTHNHDIEVRYVVAMGSSMWKVFDANSGTSRMESSDHFLRSGQAIHVFIDPFTAIQLGLVKMEDMSLPDGAKALLQLLNSVDSYTP